MGTPKDTKMKNLITKKQSQSSGLTMIAAILFLTLLFCGCPGGTKAPPVVVPVTFTNCTCPPGSVSVTPSATVTGSGEKAKLNIKVCVKCTSTSTDIIGAIVSVTFPNLAILEELKPKFITTWTGTTTANTTTPADNGCYIQSITLRALNGFYDADKLKGQKVTVVVKDATGKVVSTLPVTIK